MDRTTRRMFVLALLAVIGAVTLWWLVGHPTTTVAASSLTTGASTSTVATGLHPGLARAFDRAVLEARADGHELTLTSGFRTTGEQERLLAEAVVEHGSRDEALRWVFPPERSMHVQGLAVDVGDGPAAQWLDRHGASVGLCRTLSWEWWHFEWRAEWEASQQCPGPVDDPADAPGP